MPQPPLQRPPLPAPKRGSWLSIFLALFAGLAIFVIISLLTLGFFAPVLVIGGLIFAIVGFHYCVWGWWLGDVLRQAERERQEEEDASS